MGIKKNLNKIAIVLISSPLNVEGGLNKFSSFENWDLNFNTYTYEGSKIWTSGVYG